MNPTHAELYARILAFPIDEGTPALTFEARLARENGWTVAFARRVVAEYKRFVFLAMTAGHSVTPSEQVDQAWHLHLTYSRSYWERMCGGLLGRPLHHGPTRGGADESSRFRGQYERTLAAYRDAFGEAPPADVWPAADTRFGDDLHGVRVNTALNWVVPKAAVRVAVVGLFALAAAVFGAGCGPAGNPFALAGLDFVWFVAPVLVAALMIGLVLRQQLRGPSPESDGGHLDLDWADAAYLSGGRDRLVSAAVARLAAAGVARVTPDGKTLELAASWTTPARLSPVEEAVVRALPLARDSRENLDAASRAVDEAFAGRGEELRGAGYLLPPGRASASACLAVLPVAVAILFLALPRIQTGLLAGKPTGILIGVTVAAGLAALVVFGMAAASPLTRRGSHALRLLRAATDRRPTGVPEPGAVGLAVAVFGTASLAGCDAAELAALADWYPRQTSSSGGGCGTGCGTGGGGGCGGGGCGGGGCGGCG